MKRKILIKKSLDLFFYDLYTRMIETTHLTLLYIYIPIFDIKFEINNVIKLFNCCWSSLRTCEYYVLLH